MSAKILIDLLRNDGSVTVNKRLLKSLGLQAAFIYSEILSKYAYHETRNELTNDGYFYYTIKDMERNTTLSAYQQRQALEKLLDIGLLIDVTEKGIPAKRHIKISLDEKIIKKCLKVQQSPIKSTNAQILNNLTTRSLKTKAVNNTNNNKPPTSKDHEKKNNLTDRKTDRKTKKEITKQNVNRPGNATNNLSSYPNSSDWATWTKEQIEDIPKEYQNIVKRLIRNGITKQKAYELARRYPNSRIRDVTWFVILKKLPFAEKASEIINLLENDIKLPFKSREEKRKEKKREKFFASLQESFELFANNPDFRRALNDKVGDQYKSLTFAELMDKTDEHLISLMEKAGIL